MGAFQIFKRPRSFRLGVWAFRVIRGGNRGKHGFPSMMKVFDGDPSGNSGNRQPVRITFKFEPIDIFNQLFRVAGIGDNTTSLILG